MRSEMEKGRLPEKLKTIGRELRFIFGRTATEVARSVVEIKPDTGKALEDTLDNIPTVPSVDISHIELVEQPKGYYTPWGYVENKQPQDDKPDELPSHAREAIHES